MNTLLPGQATAALSIKMDPHEYQLLRHMSALDHRSMTHQVRHMIREAAQRRKLDPDEVRALAHAGDV